MAVPSSTVIQYYTGILRLTPSAAVVSDLSNLANTTVLLQTLEGQATVNVNPIIRVYQAAFDRVPDSGGLTYYVTNYVNGGGSGTWTLAQIATNFSNSPEFLGKYGSLSNRAYVSALYANVLQRPGEEAGIQYWTAKLDAGASRASVLLGFSESPEFQTNTLSNVQAFQEASALGTETYTGSLFAQGTGETFTLTTGIDTLPAFLGTQQNDTYNASFYQTVNGLGGLVNNQTLNPLDSLDGNGGIDTLNAQLNTSVTPLSLANLEVINATATSTATLGLANAGQVTNVNNVASTAALTVEGIAANAALSVANVTGKDTIFTYATTATAGSADVANLTVTNVVKNGGTAAKISVEGIETVNLTSSGTTANVVTLTDSSAKTVNIAGTDSLALTLGTSTAPTAINASGFVGNLTTTMAASGTLTGGLGDDSLTGAADVAGTIIGGAGNDMITAGGVTSTAVHSDSLGGGLGNDTIVDGDLRANTSTAANNDTIDGGVGFDTLSSTSAKFAAVDNTATGAIQSISNIEAITVSNTLANSLTLSKIQAGISTVNLDASTAQDAGAYTLTFDSAVANATVNLAGALNTSNDFGVTAAGTATNDAVTINNTSATNAFNGGQIVATGYETVTLNGGATTIGGAQTLDSLTLNTSNGNAATVFVTGANKFTLHGVASNNTGVQTINASGLAVQASGLTFDYTDGTFSGTGSSQSIVGSEGNDLIVAGNGKSATILGGAGIDDLTGGASADSILGGSGNDVISGGGGNDVLKGESGEDSITVGVGAVTVDGGADNDVINISNTLNTGDFIDGGAGALDTLIESTALIAAYAGVVNFENLQLTNAITQDMSLFTGNTGWTRVTALTGANSATNAAAALNTLVVDDTVDSFTLDRATGVTNGAVTVQALQDENTTFALVANDDVSLTVTAGAAASDKTIEIRSADNAGLDAVSLTTLTVTGVQNTNIEVANGSATAGFGTTDRTITVDATATTGTFEIDNDQNADTGVVLNVLGSTTARNTVFTGAGNDTITGGAANDSLVGGAGNDSISGGAENDTLTGGTGNDTISGGTGNDLINGDDGVDVINAGTGVDTVFGGASGDSITLAGSGSLLDYTATGQSYLGAAVVSGTTALVGVDVINFSALTTATNTVKLDAASLIGTTASLVTNVQSSIAAFGSDNLQVVSGHYDSLTGIFTAGATATASNSDVLVYTYGGSSTTYQAVVLQGDAAHHVTTVGVDGSGILTLTLA